MDKKILIVDDSPTVRELITDALKSKGFQILTASDGEKAINIAQKESPNLILLDVVMPGQNGFQVCRQLKTGDLTKDIKVILVTSKNQKSDRFWGLKQGADDYLIKPFEKSDLLKCIEYYI
jgi:twitching motility two-component system response regulator PilH